MVGHPVLSTKTKTKAREKNRETGAVREREKEKREKRETEMSLGDCSSNIKYLNYCLVKNFELEF